MDALQPLDVPYGNDWDDAAEAAAYAHEADRQRPWRSEIRAHIAARVAMLPAGARVLELGSGPGLLAHRVLQECPELGRYTLLDFSEPMLALSRRRLAAFPAARFVRASFKSGDWVRSVGGSFHCILSMQAIHELRHKRHAERVYRQAYTQLTSPGLIVICDHTPLDASQASAALYMTEDEQRAALTEAGFSHVEVVLSIDKLRVYSAERVG